MDKNTSKKVNNPKRGTRRSHKETRHMVRSGQARSSPRALNVITHVNVTYPAAVQQEVARQRGEDGRPGHDSPSRGPARPQRDARVWLREGMDRRKVTFDLLTDTYKLGGVLKPVDDVFREAALDASVCGVGRQNLRDAFLLFMGDRREVARGQLRRRLDIGSRGDSELSRFVTAVVGRRDPVVAAVLKQFMWQVKRKLHDLDVEHHIMPILVGKTDGGKSRAIYKFLSVVREVTDMPGDISFVADERSAPRLANSLVIFVDEMAKAQQTDVDTLKNKITSPTVTWRVLRTHRMSTEPNRATFIGASNNSVPELICDPTGLRRFFQIDCADHLDWEVVNGIDVEAVWACVSEKDPCPLLPVLDEVRRRQAAMQFPATPTSGTRTNGRG